MRSAGARPSGRTGPSAIAVTLGALVSAALLVGEVYLIRQLLPGLSQRGWLIVAGATLGYVIVAHVVRIHPDTSDLGLFGGLIDNPFSISDDINRLMLFFQILLLPGRLIAESLLGIGRLIFGDSGRSH